MESTCWNLRFQWTRFQARLGASSLGLGRCFDLATERLHRRLYSVAPTNLFCRLALSTVRNLQNMRHSERAEIKVFLCVDRVGRMAVKGGVCISNFEQLAKHRCTASKSLPLALGHSRRAMRTLRALCATCLNRSLDFSLDKRITLETFLTALSIY